MSTRSLALGCRYIAEYVKLPIFILGCMQCIWCQVSEIVVECHDVIVPFCTCAAQHILSGTLHVWISMLPHMPPS